MDSAPQTLSEKMSGHIQTHLPALLYMCQQIYWQQLFPVALHIAGVGSGKSTWVKDVLTQKGNVLFITSRRAKVDEDIAHSCFTSFVREQDGQRENLITNAKLGYILINAHADMQMTVDNFLNCYEYKHDLVSVFLYELINIQDI